MIKIRSSFFISAAFFCIFSFVPVYVLFQSSWAQNVVGSSSEEPEWTVFQSSTKLFSSFIPDNYTNQLETMHLYGNILVNNEILQSTIDQRPIKNAVKQYIVRYQQTIGPVLRQSDVETLVEADLGYYKNFYESQGYDIILAESGVYNNHFGVEIQAKIDDPERGQQTIRTYVLYANRTKLEQTFFGPNHVAFNRETKDYFDEIELSDGYQLADTNYKDVWSSYDSKLGIFKSYFPNENSIYFSEKPRVSVSNNKETIRYVYNDPLWNEQIFYNIYAYRFDQIMGEAQALAVLRQGHIRNYVISMNRTQFEKFFFENKNIIESNITIDNENVVSPYVTEARFKVTYAGNHAIVQEILGSKRLAYSKFADHLFTTIEYSQFF